jgi:hypothetical protein
MEIYEAAVLESTNATSVTELETIQSLWSGYGKIARVKLEGFSAETAIVKHIVPPYTSNHPKGWNTDNSHQRKLYSYQVEMDWYKRWSKLSGDQCRLPTCYGVMSDQNTQVIVLEDLDAVGYNLRKTDATIKQVKSCLSWLAHFHATYLNKQPTGLWEIGTYWHLATRPDEFNTMQEGALKDHAYQLDALLNNCQYQTLVHGDAKLANFCFAANDNVAAVDFQYVGGGCGIKDVAYFIGSCLSESECQSYEQELLKYYFVALGSALNRSDVDILAVEEEWRTMYPIAWADFTRFLEGWMPTHHKLHSYSSYMVTKALKYCS